VSGGATDAICFLTETVVEETDSVSETGECRVTRTGPTTWTVNAVAGAGGANNVIVTCSARCLSW